MTDPTGNEGPIDTVPFNVDTTPPVAPTIIAPTSGQLLATGTVTVSGTGEAGGTITIYSGGAPVAT